MGAVGLDAFFQESIKVEQYGGENSLGQDIFLPAITILGYSEQRRVLVRTADSEAAVGQTVVYTKTAYAGAFVAGSKVTVNGITSKVLTVATFAASGLPMPEHIAVTLG